MSNVAALSHDDLRDLYRELILNHAREPRNFGKLENATHKADGINPLCGDKLTLYVRLDSASVIQDASFEGTGCAISVASASLLTETVIGLPVDDARSWFEYVTAALTSDADVELGKLQALMGVREFPSRVKCATLSWHALNSALDNDQNPATTE
ncbi:MAG: SUF system NifU family Fe-S cluster assembly protein [Woeseiaceae bacterium]|nr:SUF system NifU family Fe-S cluster assembly protein [Woeseiaceae bacterium]